MLVGLYFMGRQPNPVFHSLAELFSTIIACGIFMMAWNSRRYLDNNSLLFIGLAYLAVGILDLVHSLAYSALYAYPAYEPNLPTQLWVAARLIQSISLLVAPIFVMRELKAYWGLLFYLSLTATVLLSIFYWNIFPVCYAEGIGPTPFKRLSEYVATGLLVGAVLVFARHRQHFDTHVYRTITLSIIFTFFSEVSFMFYARVDDQIFVIGHMLKIIAFYFIYDAVIATGLAKPYDLLVRNLKKSEISLQETVEELTRTKGELDLRVRQRTEELAKKTESLQSEMDRRREMEDKLRESEAKYRILADNTRDWEWWLAPDRQFIYLSPSCKTVTGHDPSEFIADRDLIYQIIHPHDRQKMLDHVNEVDSTLKGGEVEFRIVRPDGTERYLAHACIPVFDEEGTFLGHRGSNRDVTDKKAGEIALQKSERELRSLSSRLLTIQENERKRIARELHDGINQTLSAIKFSLETRLCNMDPSKAPEGLSLERIISLVRAGIDEARRIQMDLRPPMLDDLGIVATLNWFTREFREVYSHIRIDTKTDLQEVDVPDSLKVETFRIVQESLNNIAKHSRADRVDLSLRKNLGHIALRIEDNGIGFDMKTATRGIGIASMKERAELSGGLFSIESADGKGTTVKVEWPIG